MSILGAMFTAVSGLNAQSQSLGNISDNIANSQTVGYKKVDTRFQDLITISTRNLNLPGGVVASPYYANALQGNINQTQSTTNLAISGNGFFVVSRPTEQTGTLTTFSALPYYTRAGDFEVNRDGYVVNGGGYYLNGWAIDQTTGVPDTASLAPIQITQLTTPPTATSKIEVVGNLPATSVVNPDPPLAPTNVKIYDALGNPHTVTLNWTKRADNIWNLDIQAAGSTLDPVGGTISGTNDQTIADANTTANVAPVAQVDDVTIPAAGLQAGRTITYTIGATTVSVTAPVGGYTDNQAATALAAAINANTGLATQVTAGNVAGGTFTVTSDTAGTPFTGTIGGNGSGETDTFTLPGALTVGQTYSVTIGAETATITAPVGGYTIAQARAALITEINTDPGATHPLMTAAVTAMIDPANANRLLLQSNNSLGTFTATPGGAPTPMTSVAGTPAAETNATANVAPVAQVDTLTLGGTVGPGEIGDTWTLTIGSTTVTYVNDGTEPDINTVTANFAAKINATAGIGVTAVAAGNQIQITASNAGTPFTATVNATNGNVPGFIDLRFGTTTATAGQIFSIGNQYNTAGDATVPTSQNAGDPAQITFQVDYGSGPQTVVLDLGRFQTTDGLTQFSGTTVDIQRLSQDGVPQGLFTGVNIRDNGDVELQYDNGTSKIYYRVPIAQFYDPTALKRENGQAFTETFDSGNARLTNAGASGAGTVRASAVEGSNVDIAEEFSKMIVTQRAYAANARVITTADDMLNEVINIRR
ncbi:MAG TPA: flagellar hook-basal body complex protein [Dongiaceae bacterium]|jgi:flagellar hook protein FlgE|nr:flagellar hook-basal body complex protein [Dongiaceae bacterium]